MNKPNKKDLSEKAIELGANNDQTSTSASLCSMAIVLYITLFCCVLALKGLLFQILLLIIFFTYTFVEIDTDSSEENHLKISFQPKKIHHASAFALISLLVCFLIPHVVPAIVLIMLTILATKGLMQFTGKGEAISARAHKFLTVHPWVSAAYEGMNHVKPFILTALYIAAAPISISFIFLHWVYSIFKPRTEKDENGSNITFGTVLFKQNKSRESDKKDSFYNSPAFSITLFLVTAIGFPTIICMSLLLHTDAGDIINGANTVSNPKPVDKWVPIGPVKHKKQAVTLRIDDKDLTHYGSNFDFYNNSAGKRRFTLAKHGIKSKVSFPVIVADTKYKFAAILYIFSLAWCITLIFFRAWFTFPLNFSSTEYDIEVNELGVRKHHIKGWFSEFLWYAWPAYLPRYLPWSAVKRINYVEDGIGKLYPLPDKLFSKDSLVYKFLNKLALYFDAIQNKIGRCEYLVISNNPDSTSGDDIRIRLWELNTQEKAQLFYSIRRHAPELNLTRKVQEKLLGTTVIDEPKYTEIWFDLLMKDSENKHTKDLPSGTKLKNYSVRYKMNCGGQANIYLAKDREGRNFTLKEFTLTKGDSFGALLESASDFENEGRILSLLKHKSIVRLVDFFAQEQRAYLVLEFIKGKTLRDLVSENGPLSISETIEMAIKLCSLLKYLHELEPSVVHCDFTPENIMLTRDKEIKLIDFSVARKMNDEVNSAECVGKHSYTPPEQFRNEACPQSDIYALGAMIVYLLTGSDPKPLTTTNLLDHNIDGVEKLANIVKKATTLELEERYESIQWMKLDLEQLLTKGKEQASKFNADKQGKTRSGKIKLSPKKEFAC